MCGIVGALALNHKTIDINSAFDMTEELSHRGPDDAGYLFFHTGVHHKGFSFHLNLSDKRFTQYAPLIPDIQDEPVQRELKRHDWDLFFGHRRLAIIDLSDAGHQPMSDLSKNIWVIYNGEIYNFPEIKKELVKKKHSFQSETDTEVIIYSYVEWGINSIERFNGMFAFALYDNFNKKLYLVRDRYGIKPLYYTVIKEEGEGKGWTLIFSSEVKSILTYPHVRKKVDYDGVAEYFTFQNILSDRTLWKDIKILPPGHFIEIELKSKRKGVEIYSEHRNLISGIELFSRASSESEVKIKVVQYWDFDFISEKLKMNYSEIITSLEEIFEDAVRRQLISDVEIGSYLSGGVDSGSITAIASKYFRDEGKSFKTFTVGFDLHSASGIELSFDEREKAEHMSYLFGTEHYEMVLKAGDMEKCLPSLVYHLEEPRVGQSYPNFYAAKLASKFVKVVLSGCGGDELFGGYPWRYSKILNSKNFGEFLEKYCKFWRRLFPDIEDEEIFRPIRDKINIDTKEIFFYVFPEKIRNEKFSPENAVDVALYFEAKTFLHGLLVVEDKLSMAHSLETRVPFLDNNLVDFSTKIPSGMKVKLSDMEHIDENLFGELFRTKHGKIILRDMLKKYVPEDIAEAEKQGFSAPDRAWFKGESIEFVKKTLFKKDAFIYNFLNRDIVTRLVSDHIHGRVNRRLLLWSLLNFETLSGVFPFS